MKTLVLSFLLLFINITLRAQDNKISGTVVNLASNPISNATVSIFKAGQDQPYIKSLTKENGTFNITIKANEILQVSHLGYISFRLIWKGEPLPLIILKPDELNLAEVMIKHEKPLVELQFDRTVVNVEGDIKAGINAVDVLRKIPGVTILNGNEIRFEGKGITVNIDDKPTRLTGTDLINLLNATTTRNISKVELLYNPSSKHDAQGEGGILNFKTLKRTNPGLDGNLSLTAGHGWKYLTGNNGALSLNYRSRNNYLYLNYGLSKGKQYQEIQTSTRIAEIGQSLLDSAIYTSPYTNQNIRLGYDHYFSKSNIFGVLLTGYYNLTDPSRQTSTDIFSGLSALRDSTRKSVNNSQRISNGFNINLNYKFVIDSAKQQEITMDADGGLFHYRDNNTLMINLLNLQGTTISTPYSLLQNGNTLTRILSYKADFTQKINKNTFETGIKVSNVNISNTFISQRKNEDANLLDNGSNDFNYNETIAAAYINMKFEIGKLTFQPGLRAEQTFTDSYSPTADSTIKRNYLSLFPNFADGL